MFQSSFVNECLRLPPSKPQSFLRVWTDTRSLKAGDLFAAISGDQFDGHNFIAEAAKNGALGALVSKNEFPGRSELPKDFHLFQVADTTEALRKLAAEYRKSLKTPIFAVAGSNGKTTTKELLYFLLSQAVAPKKVFKTQKSNNSILGIALSLLQIRDEDFAVIEIGIDEPGWMAKHLEVVKPDAGLITMIGEEHLNRLKSIEKVAEEELKLLDFLRTHKGKFAANLDSPFIASQKFPTGSLSYSLEVNADIEGQYLSPQYLSAFGLKFQNPLAGKHNAQNLLGALTGLRILLPDLEIETLRHLQAALPSFRGESHRSLWLTVDRGIRIYDDCYNANGESMERAIEAFLELSQGCTQRLILGDMLDLGEASERTHSRVLNLALVSGVEDILLFGPEFKKAFERVTKLAPPQMPVQALTDIEELKTAVSIKIKHQDCLFLKGSRGMKLERVLELFENKKVAVRS